MMNQNQNKREMSFISIGETRGKEEERKKPVVVIKEESKERAVNFGL